MIGIHLATEDSLSEAVGERLVDELGPDFAVELKFRKGGFGYLRSRTTNFCEISQRSPTLLLTDLDEADCAPALISTWFKKRSIPEMLLFRVSVRTVESWLLADHAAMKKLLGNRVGKLPPQPDLLGYPKRTLLQLAAAAPGDVRNDLIGRERAYAAQGLGYNQRLCAFVREEWNPEQASKRSESLRRARLRLLELKQRLI